MIYLGTLGRMVGLKCPASQQVSPADRYSFTSTLEGRVKGQAAPALGRRSWSLSTSDATTPQDIGAIMAFINGEWGNGPFVFVSADAPAVNLLTPAAASCDPGLILPSSAGVAFAGGPMKIPGGWAGRSLINSGSFPTWNERVPVLPGVPVTASAYAMGAGGQLRLVWIDAAGTNISTVNSAALATGSTERLSVTATPPVNAASCQLFLTSTVLQATRPAVTWSDSLLEWGDGQGCIKAVIHGASRDLVLASREPRGGRYSNLSFTISEVG